MRAVSMNETSALLIVDLQNAAFGGFAQDGHSTWPDAGRPAVEIIAAQNETLAREGVRLSSTEELVTRLRAGRI